MAEWTTMSSMTRTEEDATPLSDAMAPLLAKLKAKGLTVTDDPEPAERRETPEDARDRAQRRQGAFVARWAEKVPAMYQEAVLDDLDDSQHHVRLRGWHRSGALHLVLAGPVGTGKTHAAYAVGHAALEAGAWVEAWAVGDLMDALRPGSSDSSADRRARDCQVLILDDLLAKATDWEAERMTLLLDARVRSQRQTIVTTNITSAQIAETWGGRFMDRLSYRLTALTFHGPSRRSAAW